MQWSAQIPTGFHVPRRTLEPARLPLVVVYGTLTLYGRPSHAVLLDTSDRDASPNPGE